MYLIKCYYENMVNKEEKRLGTWKGSRKENDFIQQVTFYHKIFIESIYVLECFPINND